MGPTIRTNPPFPARMHPVAGVSGPIRVPALNVASRFVL